MPKLTSSVPKYRKHKASGQAMVTLNGRDVYLGPHGTEASRIEYDRQIALWLANQRQPAPEVGAELSLADATARYWVSYVVPQYGEGKSTDQEHNIRASLRPMLKLFQELPAAKFGPLSLQAVRDEMVRSGLARTTINDRVKRIRRMFRWLVANELVPVSVYRALKTVDGLRRGQTSAREPEPVRPVENWRVEAILPHLPRVVQHMVMLQQITGMRSGELVIMRPRDIDRKSDVWQYRPASHKTQYRGRERVVFLGCRSQEIILRYLARDASSYCFSPRDSEAKRRAAQHAARKTPHSCGNRPGSNRKPSGRRRPGDRYTPESYYRAVARAIEQAFPPPSELARRRGETDRQWRDRLTPYERIRLDEYRAAHRWSPHRLRHSMATEIRERFGVEAAGVLLGHSKLESAQLYAERNANLAVRIAREVG